MTEGRETEGRETEGRGTEGRETEGRGTEGRGIEGRESLKGRGGGGGGGGVGRGGGGTGAGRGGGGEKRATQMTKAHTLDENKSLKPSQLMEERRASDGSTMVRIGGGNKGEGGGGGGGGGGGEVSITKRQVSLQEGGGDSSDGEKPRGRLGTGEKLSRAGSWLRSWKTSNPSSSSQEDVLEGEKQQTEAGRGAREKAAPSPSPPTSLRLVDHQLKPAKKLDAQDDKSSTAPRSTSPSPSHSAALQSAAALVTPPAPSPTSATTQSISEGSVFQLRLVCPLGK